MSVAKCFDIVSNVHIICKISNCFKIKKIWGGGGGLGGGGNQRNYSCFN